MICFCTIKTFKKSVLECIKFQSIFIMYMYIYIYSTIINPSIPSSDIYINPPYNKLINDDVVY